MRRFGRDRPMRRALARLGDHGRGVGGGARRARAEPPLTAERIAELREYSKLPFGPERTKLAAEQFLDRIRREREWQIALLEFRLYAARNPELTAAFANRHRRFVAAVAREGREDRPESESHLAAERAARAGIAIGNGYALERLTDPERATEEEFVRVAVILMQALEEAGGLD